jgi:ubiquinol-cytochrome c reductase cytochrome b subunit
MSSSKRKWFSDRFAFGPIWRNVFDRRVPETPWYFGDGSTLTLLLVVLVVTGALMGMTYSPAIDSAYESVTYLTHKQTLGWFIRGLHYWSAGSMVVMLFFHLFRQILIAGYKAPREGTWLVGVLLFFAVIFMSFSGYLLRWDERAITAIKVALHMFHNVPLIGDWLVVLVQGGREMGPLTLTRIYGLHVVVVPLLIFALTAYHVYLVIHHGTTSVTEQKKDVETATEQRKVYKKDAKSEERGEHFYHETLGDSGLMAFTFLVLAVILTLTLGPPELMPEAAYLERSFPAEEWWFAWYSGLIALLPNSIAPGFVVIFPLVLFIGMVLLPFIDRGPKRGMKNRPIAVSFVIFSVLAILVLSAIRVRSEWTGWPVEEPPPVPAGIKLSEEAEEGRQLFSTYGCNSCHAVGGHGRHVAVDMTHISRSMSFAELKAYIRQPPAGIAMPSYDDIPSADIDRLAEFVLAAQTFPRAIE